MEEERAIDFFESDATTTKNLESFDLKSTRERNYINDNQALVRMLISGIGFGTLIETIAEEHIEAGHLVRLNGGKTYDAPLALAWYLRPGESLYFEEIMKSIK